MPPRSLRSHNLLPKPIIPIRDPLNSRPLEHPSEPSRIRRKLSRINLLRHKRELAGTNSLEVRDEHEVSVSDPIADEERSPLAREVRVDDAEHAPHLVRVPLDGGRQPFVVVRREPPELPEVRPLPAHLEVLPAAGRVALFCCCVVQLRGLVVFFD